MAKNLLKDKRVVEEIHRHLWIESERAGFDIGFEKATQDWLERFSKAWMEYHLPKQRRPSPQKGNSTSKKTSK
ncbi:MAG: hypothetical protein Q7S13_05385 [Candidatus Omnitrophota bacterium]|nr:hypothetical protein [Candidatus Omnitrophota bacterium]